MDKLLHILEFVLVPLMVAIITAIGALWANRANQARIKALGQENTDQHDHNAGLLIHVSNQVGLMDGKVDKLDTRLDNLSVWAVEHEVQHLLDGTLEP